MNIGPTAVVREEQPGSSCTGCTWCRATSRRPCSRPPTRSPAQEQAGITFDATPKVSGADAQPAYTPRVQIIKAKDSNYVYDGSNDVAMIRIRKEALAQGVDSVKVWACSLACYTANVLVPGRLGGRGHLRVDAVPPVRGGQLNAADAAYIANVPKLDSFGAQAWQAALAFQQVVNKIVATSGPNAITRAAGPQRPEEHRAVHADGWMAPTDLRGFSPCFMMMQIQNGKYVRVYPTKPGTFDCTPSNVVSVMVDPVAAAALLK